MIESKVVTLTAALRAAGVDHRVYQIAPSDFGVQATSNTLYTAAQLQNLETAHGVTARTNRADFT